MIVLFSTRKKYPFHKFGNLYNYRTIVILEHDAAMLRSEESARETFFSPPLPQKQTPKAPTDYNTLMEELLRLPPVFDPPLMNAAGTLGFAPDRRKPLDWAQFGAFVTNPISLRPRRPAASKAASSRWQISANTALVHTGLPNPGYRKVIKQFAPQWAMADLPIIVHIMADAPIEIGRIIPRFEVLENVIAIELGFPEEVEANTLRQVVAASLGELPLLVCLPFSQAASLAPIAVESGAAAISLAPPRGQLPNSTGGFNRGRIYGHPIFPQALHIVRQLAALQIQVIGAGGVYTPEQASVMRQAGALAVQLDLALWRGDWFSTDEKED